MDDRTDFLAKLDLGASVAEHDENLASYFVPTVPLSDFLDDRYDIILGAKGSGKSAILRVVSEKQAQYPQLDDVELLVAIEHTGEPAFKRAFEHLKVDEIREQQLVDAWKSYLLNLAFDALEKQPQTKLGRSVLKEAESSGLRFRTARSKEKVWWSLLRFLNPQNFTIGPEGIHAEFPDAPPQFWTDSQKVVDFPDLLKGCADAFKDVGKRCWLLVDRLDAAFLEPTIERVALRAMLTAYKDFMGQKYIRPKLFFRTDLFGLVVNDAGFRELTHINDRSSPPISWDTDKLLHMIMERFAFNDSVCEFVGLEKAGFADPELRESAFYLLFPKQVDVGPRKPDTWSWMCSRIRDGNSTRTPRDLHALVKHAVTAQREDLAIGRGDPNEPLIGSAAIKVGLRRLSNEKVKSTLLAENHDLADAIKAFHKQKAEQNEESLSNLLGRDWESKAERLVRIGFLERTGSTWKVPMLYRDGLEIVQGAAFDKSGSEDD